jgi:hypothetical protein
LRRSDRANSPLHAADHQAQSYRQKKLGTKRRSLPMVQGLEDVLLKARQVNRALQRQGENPLPVQARPDLDALTETLSRVRYEEEDG